MITKKSIKGKYDNSSKQSTCTKTKRRIIKILKKLESEIELDLFNIKKESKPVALDQQAVGRVSRIDAIQQQVQLASVKAMELRLSQIRSSISRVNDKDIGICIECEEPIAFARLKIMPETKICVPCLSGNKN